MSIQSPRRPYTAELIMARNQGGLEANNIPSAGQSGGVGSAAEILAAIAALRQDLSDGKIKLAANSAPAEVPAPTAKSVEPSPEADEKLKEQLTELSQAIADTKRELASLRTPSSRSGVEINSATQELDAVVEATETATNDIMNAAEQIDDLAGRLRSQSQSQSEAALAEEINDRVVNIFEACNFQDITGQRITKVVNTLAYIDERVSHMMNMWGAEQIDGVAVVSDGDEALLNGPAPMGEGSSQDDIDALFD